MQDPDTPPKLFRTWRRLYGAVIVYLIAIIVFFTVFTKAFNR